MKKKKILFLSYFFPPFESVGVKRIAYWYNNISEYGYKAVVFTAIKQTKKDENIHYVAPENNNSLLSKLIKDKGLAWINPLKKRLKQYNKEDFDIILISGGPFMQMLISKFLKNNFNTKVILDFRDPFYANPRFPKNKIKDFIKLYFQNRFLKYADVVITVNSECKKLINHNNIELIDNGFDETILNTLSFNRLENNTNKSIHNGIATGRVDSDFDITPFFHALEKDTNISFGYIGNHDFKEYSGKYHHGGVLEYSKALEFINNADFCILFTGGEAFESSTKIFDYLGLNKTILIITQGEVKTGSLHEITNAYPNVFWTKNNIKDILQAFSKIKKHKNLQIDTNKYARKEGLKLLTQIIER